MWKFLDGKKTVIGAVLWLIVAVFVLLTGQDVEGFTAPESWSDFITVGLTVFSGILQGVGVLHKYIKSLSK